MRRKVSVFHKIAFGFATVLIFSGFFFEAEAFQPQLAAGLNHTVGLQSDGTLIGAGDNSALQIDIGTWSNIIQVAAGGYHTVGLKADGTVVAVGDNSIGQLGVGAWSGIIQVAAGEFHTVGLKSDGTVVAVGNSADGQLNVGSWNNVIQIASGFNHTAGLKSDGTVVAVGDNSNGQTDTLSWSGIKQISAGWKHTVALKSNGTVEAVGFNNEGQLNVSSWTNIAQVSAGDYHTLGLKYDGTAVAVGKNDYSQLNVGSWTGIVKIAAGYWHSVGLMANGTCTAIGYNLSGQSNITGWNLGQSVAIGLFRPTSGYWFLDRNAQGQWDRCGVDGCYYFGMNGDLAAAGDWNGDGLSKIGVFRPNTGMWYVDLNGNGQWDNCTTDGCYNFGMSGDLPIAGDWNNDGFAEIGVFRAGTGMWYVDGNGNNQWDGCGTDGCYNFGMDGDLPVSGDWNNDSIADIGVFRPSTGMWYLDLNGNHQWDGCSIDGCYRFGIAGDLPVAGNWR